MSSSPNSFTVDYTVVPRWFGGDAQAREAINQLASGAAAKMNCGWEVAAIYDHESIRFGSHWIARIRFLPSMW